jgi:hypothetical protein
MVASAMLLRCRCFGWWSLLVWLSLGLLLEAMHGFKIGWYLDVGSDARRLLLRLAHAHGVLLSLVVLAFAATAVGAERTLLRAGMCLRWAAVLMPLGFLLGGLWPMGGDPGLGIVLVPIGGVLLFVGVLATARSGRGSSS